MKYLVLKFSSFFGFSI